MKKKALVGIPVYLLVFSLSSTEVSRAEGGSPWFPWWPPNSIHDWVPPAIGCAGVLLGWYVRGARDAFRAHRAAFWETRRLFEEGGDGWGGSVILHSYGGLDRDLDGVAVPVLRILVDADYGSFKRKTNPDSQAGEISQEDFERLVSGIKGGGHYETTVTQDLVAVPMEGFEKNGYKVASVQLRYGGSQGVLVLSVSVVRLQGAQRKHYYRIEGIELEPNTGAAGG